jgi:preprotein translocase subunit SecE
MKLKENRLIKYLIDSKTELKKVTWPTKKETTKLTLIVLGVSVFTAAFLGVLDLGFDEILSFVIR